MSLKTFYCPICGEEEEDCLHTEDIIYEFQAKERQFKADALEIIRQIIGIDKLQDMPVVPEWEPLVKKAKDFLKNNA